MTKDKKKEQSIKTVLRFFKEYITKNSDVFTLEMFKKSQFFSEEYEESILDDIVRLNQYYERYLRDEESLCQRLINDVGQQYGLRKGMRENTTVTEDLFHSKNEDFDALCEAADTLQIVSAPKIDGQIDFIIVPGALQGGVEKRMNTLLAELEHRPDFQGKILVFGSRDRKLYPFSPDGSVKEKLCFNVLADMLNKEKKVQKYTPESIQGLLTQQYLAFKSESLTETEIAERFAKKWKENCGMEWPTEYQMVCLLADEKLKKYSVETIETFKQTQDSRKRATTEDEAVYVAGKIQELSQKRQEQFVPSLAVVTNYGYQVETYRGALKKRVQNFQIGMLSPYKSTKEYLNTWGRSRWQGKTETEVRHAFTVELLDSFARLMYSTCHECRFEKAVREILQKNSGKDRS